MILSKPDIEQYLNSGKLKFDPQISPDQIAQVSIDLRLGRKFTILKSPPKYLPAVHIDSSLWDSLDLWEEKEQSTYRLEPGHFVLAQSLERVTIPSDLVGLVEGRSSWARMGITIHVTAPKIDPGFDAHITLELFNMGKVAVELQAEIDKPAQLMFLTLSTELPADQLYGTGAQDTFQGQTSPIPRRPKK